ncbi:MAG: NAD-dependent epimerase/dehydratase family protein, partial [Bacillota bacterium]
MSVLIVGGAGFIGAYLTRRLLRDAVRVVVLDSAFSNVIHEVLTPEELGEVTLVSGDVNSLRDLGHVIREHGVRRLVNLASLLHPVCDHNPPKALAVNVDGQLAVLEAARLWNLEKVVWASSVVVFGDRTHQLVLPVPNDAPHHPVSV